MTLSKTITIEVESECSEADLYVHLNEIVDSFKTVSLPGSIYRKVYTDYEEDYPVEINIEEVK
jgi:hypothetical protein